MQKKKPATPKKAPNKAKTASGKRTASKRARPAAVPEAAGKRRLFVRNATTQDIKGIQRLVDQAYPGNDMLTYAASQLRGQMTTFPEGQFVAMYGDEVVGYAGTFVISGGIALKPHTWKEITGGGYASRHDPNGDWLYGMEMSVHPGYRGLRIGQRLYNARKKLCTDWNLKGIVFGGRLPSWSKRAKKYDNDIHAYIEAVKKNQVRDQVMSFQLRNDFEPIGILPGYLGSDAESLGVAVHMVWRNPNRPAGKEEARQKGFGVSLSDNVVRVATVQYMQRRVTSFEQFLGIAEYFVDVAADYRADFVVFPELFALQLLSIEDQELSAAESIEALTRYTPKFREAFSSMAVRYNINIIAGSHPTKMANGRVENIAYVMLRDGSVHEQPKIHPTPSEAYWWNIEGGDYLNVIDTDCGPIGVMICYDSEFPELGRHLIDQGANILFVPFCTDERQSYLRVRYSCQARAVENQCYVVMSGNVGNLPNVSNMDIQYAQSCILTPCDFPFARDGIAADTTPNVETVAFADLRLDALREARYSGTVQNLKNRRHDLYSVVWHKKD
ncbi:MAG: GNAT family N-acetyltransferase [Gammaproteobacteria bacterium]|nr:MAG: GNAT family N-acetyltransferase [Gammaproteobacteria bacterium]